MKVIFSKPACFNYYMEIPDAIAENFSGKDIEYYVNDNIEDAVCIGCAEEDYVSMEDIHTDLN